jgi:hypothetical protein
MIILQRQQFPMAFRCYHFCSLNRFYLRLSVNSCIISDFEGTSFKHHGWFLISGMVTRNLGSSWIIHITKSLNSSDQASSLFVCSSQNSLYLCDEIKSNLESPFIVVLNGLCLITKRNKTTPVEKISQDAQMYPFFSLKTSGAV